jgi:hypothetical protein
MVADPDMAEDGDDGHAAEFLHWLEFSKQCL